MGAELVALGASLLAAGILARAGRRIGLPTIPLFMIAGIVFGPNTPGLSFFDNPGDLSLLATLGLVLLLFYLGLEFSLGDLAQGGRRLVGAGVMYLTLNVGAGLVLGFSFGWGNREALVIAGAVGISSSAIVTKLLVELRRVSNPETRVILGVVVVEDIFLALYLSILQPVLGDAQGTTEILISVGSAFGFLIVLAVVARKGAALVGRLIATDDEELLTVCFVGFAVLLAGIAEEVGVSDAIGAFMAGLILAESPARRRIERAVLPLRDTFAAVFFFAFGLTIDPGDLGDVAVPIAAAVLITFALNIVAGILTARLYRFHRRAAANVGLTILARGEFSLILASLALSAGLDARIGPFVAGYVLILALGAPILASQSKALSRFIPRRVLASSEPSG
ncbi:MAG: cation:proton antiporter [Acidimicrobiia bacterium]